MLSLLVDMGILWLLLNMFSEQNWDDQKLKVFGIAIAIAILGGLAAGASVVYVGAFPAIGAYFLVGTICLWGLASLQIQKAAAAMGIFTVFKFGVAFAWLFLASPNS
jgi:hypothetical protein